MPGTAGSRVSKLSSGNTLRPGLRLGRPVSSASGMRLHAESRAMQPRRWQVPRKGRRTSDSKGRVDLSIAPRGGSARRPCRPLVMSMMRVSGLDLLGHRRCTPLPPAPGRGRARQPVVERGRSGAPGSLGGGDPRAPPAVGAAVCSRQPLATPHFGSSGRQENPLLRSTGIVRAARVGATCNSSPLPRRTRFHRNSHPFRACDQAGAIPRHRARVGA